MKNIITIIVCVLIIAIFVVQISVNEVTHTKILFAETEVNATMQVAKQEGCLTEENINSLKSTLSRKLKIDESDITVTGTTAAPVYRGELISYKVTYKIKGVIGASSILGISDSDNNVIRTIEGAVVSEYVGD